MARKLVGVRTCVCQGCGEEFNAKRSDAKWCPVCRVGVAALQKARDFETRSRGRCQDCGNLCQRRALRCRACDNKFRNGLKIGALNPSWKGGRTKHSDGYIEMRIDGRKVLEHRYVWEQAHGPLPQNWVVHHLNGIKDDNRIENLVGMARSHHGPRAHIDPSEYEARIRTLEARIRELEKE